MKHRSKNRIFIYGDSNVWGDNFAGARIRHADRWVNRLARALRGRAHIIADGVPGRVAGEFRRDKPHKNGLTHFKAALIQAGPIDHIIIALGTNDIQERYGRSVDDILADLLAYKQMAGETAITYLLPPTFETGERSGPDFTEQAAAKQRKLLERKTELGMCIELPNIPLSDGIHFSAQGHRIVAKIVKDMIMLYS